MFISHSSKLILILSNVYSFDECYSCIHFIYMSTRHANLVHIESATTTVLPAKSVSDVVFCLQSYQGLIIDGSPVY